MKILDVKKQFGGEYPAAIVVDGIRIPLSKERQFSRCYDWDDHKSVTEISRFLDGSASVTASELQQEWPTWKDETRLDFCQNCCWLHEQADFPDMLRFIMQHGSPDDWSGIALSVASLLPRDESFEALVRALRGTELGRSSNIAQAIARTKHPEAVATLRGHLAALWAHPTLWEDDEFNVGFDVMTCIQHLIELDAPPSDFTDQVRRLSEHACSDIRRFCRNHLSKHYSWLK